MFTILIPVRDQEEALLRTLAALAPAAAAGLVADVVVADHGSRDATLAVADAAGCTIAEGCANRAAAIEQAAALARKSWLLELRAGDLPGDAVLAAARDHIGRGTADGNSRPAAFLVRPPGNGTLRGALPSLAFTACGLSHPRLRRVLAPRGAAHHLWDGVRRWGGVRLKPRIGRIGSA